MSYRKIRAKSVPRPETDWHFCGYGTNKIGNNTRPPVLDFVCLLLARGVTVAEVGSGRDMKQL